MNLADALFLLLTCVITVHLVLAHDCSQIDHCKQCNEPAKACSQCPARYGFQYNMVGCGQCPADCLTCAGNVDDVMECSACDPGFTLKADRTGCIACSTANCLTCDIISGTTTQCSSCKNPDQGGNYHFLTSSKDCVRCPTNCMTCNAAAQCQTCTQGYWKRDNGACQACSGSCKECGNSGSDAESCTTCASGYVVNNSGTGALCLICQNNCETCAKEPSATVPANAKCSACKEKSFLNGDQCQSCIAGCVVCSDAASCTSCMDGFWKDPTEDTCHACTDHDCGTCTATNQCSACKPGFAVIDEPTCSNCGAFCATCTSTGLCTSCVAGYVVSGGVCIACPDKCNSCSVVGGRTTCNNAGCASGYAINTQGLVNTCEECPVKCSSCMYDVAKMATSCTTCTSRYITHDVNGLNQCAACPSNCKSCIWKNTYTSCVTCDPAFYTKESDSQVGQDICVGCSVDHCKTCASNSCSRCLVYYKRHAGTCYACPSNCSECSYSDQQTNCDQNSCDAGYFRETKSGRKICTKCSDDNCVVCSDVNTCTSCLADFVINTDTDQCIGCPANCLTCSYNGGAKCDTCDSGYVHNADKTKCLSCPKHCRTCTADAQEYTTCTACDADHWLDQPQCAACPVGCSTCSENRGSLICSMCSNGYALKDGQCTPCVKHCDACSYNGGNLMCTSCMSGYTLSNSSMECKLCSALTFADCLTCSQEDGDGKSQCLSCSSGNALNYRKTACFPCTEVDSKCTECYDRTYECTECDPLFDIAADKTCSYFCYSCGAPDDHKEECGKAVTSSSTHSYNKTDCRDGVCWVSLMYKNKKEVFHRGCTEDTSCNADRKKCVGTGVDKNCVKCCEGTLCNTYSIDSAVSIVMDSLILVIAAAIPWILDN